MAPEYARAQPEGFVNRIEKVAMVGVRIPKHFETSQMWPVTRLTNYNLGWRQSGQIHC
jgi:hypothetical protein